MDEWPALLMACLFTVASAFACWWVRKERNVGVRLNFFSLIHPDGKPWPPFGRADFIVPILFGLVAVAFVAKFLGIF